MTWSSSPVTLEAGGGEAGGLAGAVYAGAVPRIVQAARAGGHSEAVEVEGVVGAGGEQGRAAGVRSLVADEVGKERSGESAEWPVRGREIAGGRGDHRRATAAFFPNEDESR